MKKLLIFICSQFCCIGLLHGQNVGKAQLGLDVPKALLHFDKYTDKRKLEGFISAKIKNRFGGVLKIGGSSVNRSVDDKYYENKGWYIKSFATIGLNNPDEGESPREESFFIYGGVASSFNRFVFYKGFSNVFDQGLQYQTKERVVILFPELGIKGRYTFYRFLNFDLDFSLRYINPKWLQKENKLAPSHVAGYGALKNSLVPSLQVYYFINI